jgi:SAM-dependent methyltransferase
MFEDISDVYEALVDWPTRLANETPFYRHWFSQTDVHRVLDVACGTGHHAVLFHDWGLNVEAADISPAMLEKARRRCKPSSNLRWVQRGFEEPVDSPASFDAALCVGNSLALAPDLATASRALHNMLAAIRAGGLLIIQLLNLWRLPAGPCAWQRCRPVTLPDGTAVVVKGVHRCAKRGYVDLVLISLEDARIVSQKSTPLLGLDADQLVATLRSGGATQTHVFGDHHQQPYEETTSVDLILVALK